jgi:hypothetical protein
MLTLRAAPLADIQFTQRFCLDDLQEALLAKLEYRKQRNHRARPALTASKQVRKRDRPTVLHTLQHAGHAFPNGKRFAKDTVMGGAVRPAKDFPKGA